MKEGRYEKSRGTDEFDGSASAVLSELNFNLFGFTSSCFFLRRTGGRERLGVEFHPLAQKSRLDRKIDRQKHELMRDGIVNRFVE